MTGRYRTEKVALPSVSVSALVPLIAIRTVRFASSVPFSSTTVPETTTGSTNEPPPPTSVTLIDVSTNSVSRMTACSAEMFCWTSETDCFATEKSRPEPAPSASYSRESRSLRCSASAASVFSSRASSRARPSSPSCFARSYSVRLSRYVRTVSTNADCSSRVDLNCSVSSRCSGVSRVTRTYRSSTAS
ncbi:hypothetical protein C2R22_15460 [Salinigranum rubrum]|uniref:Uncharacterized protein n=1 Tax=Salinigranum rubrum TaxID=755307 RepID=A0A2I8VLV7_9EURY|nr:hypothetical protein C2R22_15460 [Salinigranum rubrum]